MKPVHVRAIVKRRDQFEQGLRELVVLGIKDKSIAPCNPKLAIFMMMGALNWSRKWYRPNGSWTGAQIAQAMTQMLERSISNAPLAALAEDPAVALANTEDPAVVVASLDAPGASAKKPRRRLA